MEQPPIPPPGTSLFQLNMDAGSSYTLRGAASWAKAMAVIAIIFGILFFTLAFLIHNEYNKGSQWVERALDTRDSGTAVIVCTIIFIVIGIFFLISGIFALNFGNKTGRALRTNNSYLLRAGFSALRNHFVFRTIIMIIFLLVFILFLIGIMNQPDDGIQYRYND
jgi:hypothetical protein